jgi:hypothetical protein
VSGVDHRTNKTNGDLLEAKITRLKQIIQDYALVFQLQCSTGLESDCNLPAMVADYLRNPDTSASEAAKFIRASDFVETIIVTVPDFVSKAQAISSVKLAERRKMHAEFAASAWVFIQDLQATLTHVISPFCTTEQRLAIFRLACGHGKGMTTSMVVTLGLPPLEDGDHVHCIQDYRLQIQDGKDIELPFTQIAPVIPVPQPAALSTPTAAADIDGVYDSVTHLPSLMSQPSDGLPAAIEDDANANTCINLAVLGATREARSCWDEPVLSAGSRSTPEEIPASSQLNSSEFQLNMDIFTELPDFEDAPQEPSLLNNLESAETASLDLSFLDGWKTADSSPLEPSRVSSLESVEIIPPVNNLDADDQALYKLLEWYLANSYVD